MRMRAAASLLSAIALFACAELRWQKDGEDETALAADLSACRKLAQVRAASAGNIGLPPVTDPRFGPPAGPSQAEQRLQERQAADTCMREKGYALVPVDK